MKNILAFLFTFFSIGLSAQITLSHNVGDVPIETGMPSCERDESWARVFKLSEFGISKSEQFIIKSGQVALSKAHGGASVGFGIFSIDGDFPNSQPRYLGGGGLSTLPVVNGPPQIFQTDFNYPIVVPATVERILVVVTKRDDSYNPNSAEVVIAGTEQDNAESWYLGCREYYNYVTTENLNDPVPNANFFINVTGEKYNNKSLGSTTTLTHNVCDQPIWVNQYGCTGGAINFSRRFVLSDFGISNNEEFVIKNGQVAFSAVGDWDVRIQFNIYKIDSNFPDSFSSTDLIGSSQVLRLFSSSNRNNPIIYNLEFENPIVVPEDVENILVEVNHLWSTGYSAAFIAGTEYDNDVSWIKSNTPGCPPHGYYESRDISYYINVTGNVNHVTNNFEMNISNICSEFLKEFSIEKKDNVASVVWNFGDPASGIDNTSTDLSPFHDFSQDGRYTITATVTGKDSSVEVLSETIDVKEPPNAYGIDDIYACEDNFATGYSSTFEVSMVEQQILGSQTNKVVTYIDGSGNEYEDLPNPFSNTIKDRETITVRVAHNDNPCCYSEITFDLIVNPLPDLAEIEDLIVCDNQTNGFAHFDLQKVKDNIIGGNANLGVEFYHQNSQQVQEPLNKVENLVPNEEVIRVRATNTITLCFNESTFKLKVNPLPVANILYELIGCDDNNDGVSEYFDTTDVETDVLGNQTGMEVSYFDAQGNQFLGPLDNPYTNTIPNQEIITVRVTNPQTLCYAQTPLTLSTATQPRINKPANIYACNEGNGFGIFNTTLIEAQLTENQSGLAVFYFDAGGNVLPSPLPDDFENTEPWLQTITARVENELNNLCYSETSFDLVVNELPKVDIEETYFLCNLEPSMYVSIHDGFDSYVWKFQDGTVLSYTNEVDLVDAGYYTLTIGENTNGIYCENSYDFELMRSVLPEIEDIEYKELSDENYIKIIATGDGDFEYSVNGVDYQNGNVFTGLQGGIYTAFVRDRFGCGEDFKEVVVVNYPKFFTPNGDGINDVWQILGIAAYPNAEIFIYDRYGKLLKQVFANNTGWDGTFKGRMMNATDYWFTVKLNENQEFSGHFSLKM
ncbi:T9SS type B sorting domain-containing protein [Flavisericum labens]|uniref:T9SS type B sorting domain-containing protein n=1 Tax=Flavisericum labens TaxID=3377112 RepID=UPI00387AF42A